MRTCVWLSLLLLLAVCAGCHAGIADTGLPPGDGVRVEQNAVYGIADGQPLLLDAYLPPRNGRGRAAVIWIHGGSWAAGDKRDWAGPARTLAHDGFVGFSIDYRLFRPATGQNRWPAQIEDARRAVRWVRANAARFGVDPQRIAAFGHSSGGQMAALLGTTDALPRAEDASLAPYSARADAVIDLAGPVDFTRPAMFPALSPQEQEVPKQLLGKTLPEAPALYRSFSPAALVDRKTVPFLVLYGAQDTVVPTVQGDRMVAALRAAHRSATLAVRPDSGHVLREPAEVQWLESTMERFLQRAIPPRNAGRMFSNSNKNR